MSRVALRSRAARGLAVSLLLAVFAARALITPGFMPAEGRVVALELCPEGLPAWLDPHAGHHHHHQGGTHARSEHCVFAGACTAGPVTQAPQPDSACITSLTPSVPCPVSGAAVRLVHLPPSRAPPASV